MAYINNVVRAEVNVVDVNNVSLTLGTTGSRYFQHNMLSLLTRVYLPTISVTTDMPAAPIQASWLLYKLTDPPPDVYVAIFSGVSQSMNTVGDLFTVRTLASQRAGQTPHCYSRHRTSVFSGRNNYMAMNSYQNVGQYVIVGMCRTDI